MYCNSDKFIPLLKSDIKIIVEKVKVEGNGVILLTGPSSCGKGEVAKSLCRFLSISEERHLSMGDILRKTIALAKENEAFKLKLSKDYGISSSVSIFDTLENTADIIAKAETHKRELLDFFNNTKTIISQLDWLEYCINKGLLVPDDWTRNIIDALFEGSPELQKGIFILDGYPRTPIAAESLLNTFARLNIPIIKVLHLSITKQQMKIRALNRSRLDDNEESLERRYHFYIDKVQPCIDYLKHRLGSSSVVLIDAHRPVFNEDGSINVEASIHEVTLSVMQALGLPGYLLDL